MGAPNLADWHPGLGFGIQGLHQGLQRRLAARLKDIPVPVSDSQKRAEGTSTVKNFIWPQQMKPSPPCERGVTALPAAICGVGCRGCGGR